MSLCVAVTLGSELGERGILQIRGQPVQTGEGFGGDEDWGEGNDEEQEEEGWGWPVLGYYIWPVIPPAMRSFSLVGLLGASLTAFASLTAAASSERPKDHAKNKTAAHPPVIAAEKASNIQHWRNKRLVRWAAKGDWSIGFEACEKCELKTRGVVECYGYDPRPIALHDPSGFELMHEKCELKTRGVDSHQ